MVHALVSKTRQEKRSKVCLLYFWRTWTQQYLFYFIVTQTRNFQSIKRSRRRLWNETFFGLAIKSMKITGGLTNPRPWRGRCRAGFSNTGGPPLPRKRAPSQKKIYESRTILLHSDVHSAKPRSFRSSVDGVMAKTRPRLCWSFPNDRRPQGVWNVVILMFQ